MKIVKECGGYNYRTQYPAVPEGTKWGDLYLDTPFTAGFFGTAPPQTDPEQLMLALVKNVGLGTAHTLVFNDETGGFEFCYWHDGQAY